MKNKWLGIIFLTPMLAACNQDVVISSDIISPQQLDRIITNINNQYPDAAPSLKQDIADVVVKSIENMVFVEGGSFMMGDFLMPCINDDLNRPVWTPEAKCFSWIGSVKTGAKYLHKVTLDSYSLSKYETEMLDFDVYFQTLGMQFVQREFEGKPMPREKLKRENYVGRPAKTKNWQQAKDYCQWLGGLASLPFDLPTEAQWEYAARSRGKNIYYATNNGFLQYENGIYYDEDDKVRKSFSAEDANVGSHMSINNVGEFPPNSLGLFDMTGNAGEWVNDWYSANYYKNSPEHNPQGPIIGEEKILRVFKTIARGKENPTQKGYAYRFGFRCSVQQSQIIY
ncbi:SUMF1/EgtB/PvdO family nonheme iron enzyme [Vibrio scophthalmi]|uniref:formylglycine-generating enzyme family protein n=1 Tax=Vibrio scophthalmi TaxID=45658 RepID=UPI002283EC9E|nr:SUMF1/EgtB/PvdO family nonheme iron enzyme [Vibrio scophthalmi]MCY9803156.1 SUMF1/EgtB/PvdO family nonheme iron enzyme [Vibrio scophthalmi]